MSKLRIAEAMAGTALLTSAAACSIPHVNHEASSVAQDTPHEAITPSPTLTPAPEVSPSSTAVTLGKTFRIGSETLQVTLKNSAHSEAVNSNGVNTEVYLPAGSLCNVYFRDKLTSLSDDTFRYGAVANDSYGALIKPTDCPDGATVEVSETEVEAQNQAYRVEAKAEASEAASMAAIEQTRSNLTNYLKTVISERRGFIVPNTQQTPVNNGEQVTFLNPQPIDVNVQVVGYGPMHYDNFQIAAGYTCTLTSDKGRATTQPFAISPEGQQIDLYMDIPHNDKAYTMKEEGNNPCPSSTLYVD